MTLDLHRSALFYLMKSYKILSNSKPISDQEQKRARVKTPARLNLYPMNTIANLISSF